LVFSVVSFLLAFPPISYMHSCSPTFMLHALPISSSLTWLFHAYCGDICGLISIQNFTFLVPVSPYMSPSSRKLKKNFAVRHFII
jgi:hypothetical protein